MKEMAIQAQMDLFPCGLVFNAAGMQHDGSTVLQSVALASRGLPGRLRINIGASIITNTNLVVPYYKYSIMGPPNPILF